MSGRSSMRGTCDEGLEEDGLPNDNTWQKDFSECLSSRQQESELTLNNIVILVITFLNNILTYGFMGSVGIFHVIFLEHFEDGNSLISVISALHTASAMASAPFAGILSKKIGYRFTAVLGGILASSGLVLSMFASNVLHLILTFGILTGTGIGFAYIPPVCITGERFRKYNTIALSIVLTGVGVGPFLFPLLIRYTVATYGWRGSFLIVGGTLLNICVLGSMLYPSKRCIDQNQNKVEKKQQKTRIFKILRKAFSNRAFLFNCFQNLAVYVGYSAIMVHLSAFAQEELGITFNLSAMLFSYMGISNVIGRIITGFLAQYQAVRIVYLYTSFLSLTGILTVMCGAIKVYQFYIFFAVAFGFLTSVVGLVASIVIEITGTDILPIAYGAIVAFEGVGLLIGPTFAGWMFDVTGAYPVSLYVSGALMTTSSIALTIAIAFFSENGAKIQEFEEVFVKLEQTLPYRDKMESTL